MHTSSPVSMKRRSRHRLIGLHLSQAGFLESRLRQRLHAGGLSGSAVVSPTCGREGKEANSLSTFLSQSHDEAGVALKDCPKVEQGGWTFILQVD